MFHLWRPFLRHPTLLKGHIHCNHNIICYALQCTELHSTTLYIDMLHCTVLQCCNTLLYCIALISLYSPAQFLLASS